MEQKLLDHLAGLTVEYDGLSLILKKARSTLKSDLSRRPGTLPPPAVVGARGQPIWIVSDVLDWLRAKQLRAGEKRQQPAHFVPQLGRLGASKKHERIEAKRLGITVRELRRRDAAAATATASTSSGAV